MTLRESFDKLNVIIDNILTVEETVRLLVDSAIGMSTLRGGLFMRLASGCVIYGIEHDAVKSVFTRVVKELSDWLDFAAGEPITPLTHFWEALDSTSIIILEK